MFEDLVFDFRKLTIYVVPGHAGKLVFGYVGPSRIPTVLMNGRAQ